MIPKKKRSQKNGEENKVINASIPRHLDIKIPTFDGKHEEYPVFIASFKIATDHPRVTKLQKFLTLKKHLEKAPLLLMTGRPASDENFDYVLTQLEHDYNMPTKIIEALQTKIKILEPAIDTATSLRNTYLELEAFLRSLEQQKVEIDKDESLRKTILTKFPVRVIDAISVGQKLTISVLRVNLNT